MNFFINFKELTKDGLIDNLMPFLKKHIKDTKEVEPFFDKCSYMSGSYSDFSKLNEFLGSESDNRLFYLSLPPNAFLDAAKAIGKVFLKTHQSIIGMQNKKWMESNCCRETIRKGL